MPEIYIFEETLDKTYFLNVCFYILQLSLGKSLNQYLGKNYGQENLQKIFLGKQEEEFKMQAKVRSFK